MGVMSVKSLPEKKVQSLSGQFAVQRLESLDTTFQCRGASTTLAALMHQSVLVNVMECATDAFDGHGHHAPRRVIVQEETLLAFVTETNSAMLSREPDTAAMGADSNARSTLRTT